MNIKQNKYFKCTHVLVFRGQDIPHGGHNFGDLAKGRVRVLALDGSLCVPEEQSVRGHGSIETGMDDNDNNMGLVTTSSPSNTP